jgi:hypothetical protein
VLALHHVPDLHAALAHIKTLLAPGGRALLMDMMYAAGPVALPRRVLRQVLPLRWRLHGLAVQKLVLNLYRRGPAAAWKIYRLSTGAWLDHRVSDQFFTREQLEQACRSVFPACSSSMTTSALTRAGAAWLADHDAALVGIDALNIDDTADSERPAHTLLLAAGIPVVEHLTGLEQLPPTGAWFTAVPLRIEKLSTIPVRAFARLPV